MTMKSNEKRREDYVFMPDTFVAELETLPIALHAVVWVTVAFVVIAILWASFATLDEVARAEGRVIPSSQTQIVQNLEGGIVADVLVDEGDIVTRGQPLIQLDDTRFASSYNEGKLGVYALIARIARLQAEIDGEEFVAPAGFPEEHHDIIQGERRLFSARQQELSSSLDILEQQLAQQRQSLKELKAREQQMSLNAELAQRELAITEPLVETGAVSRVEVLRLQVVVNESLGELEVVRLAIPKAQAAINEAEEKISERRQQFRREALAALNEAKNQLSRQSISNVALQDRVDRTEVRSPVDGTIKQVLVNTKGAVIQPGMDLVEIVPSNDSLLVEARVRPADIAFIHPGQPATVKITAYDFAIYGGLDATLEFISADTITDERGEHFFKIQVRTAKTHLGTDANRLPIIPGMVATVDILTGEKTVMDYILKPLRRAQASALSER